MTTRLLDVMTKSLVTSPKVTIASLILFMTTSLMTLSNPSREEYLDHVITVQPEILCQQLTQRRLGNICQVVGRSIKFLTVRDPAKSLVDMGTHRQNFVVFSIYTTDILGYRFHTLGIAGNFMILSKS